MRKFSCFIVLFFSLWIFGQAGDSVSIRKDKRPFESTSLIIPVAMMTTGSVIEWAREHPKVTNNLKTNKDALAYHRSVEDFVQFVPHAATFGFEWIGMKPKTDWKNRAAIVTKGSLLNLSLVFGMKYLVSNQRPDGSWYSFPSGHTANAFAGATFLAMEYGEQYSWVPYAAYGTASFVGGMRIYHNRHRLSDVLFGAGIGLLSAKMAYWTHQYRWDKKASSKDPFQVLYTEEQNEN